MAADRVRMPAWYVAWCDLMSRAVWRGLVTEREATVGLRVMHHAALGAALAASAVSRTDTQETP